MEWISTGPAETHAFGQHLGQRLQSGDVLALIGDLGAGKTALVQGVARGLQITERVASPTFVLVNEYETPAGLWLRHMDCYRLATAAEAQHLGFSDWLHHRDSILVIEWADRIRPLLPCAHLAIHITRMPGASDSLRHLVLHAYGERFGQLLSDLSGGDRSVGHAHS